LYGSTSFGSPKWNCRYSFTARFVSYTAGPPPALGPVLVVLGSLESMPLRCPALPLFFFFLDFLPPLPEAGVFGADDDTP
jgi:hypothetical protein